LDSTGNTGFLTARKIYRNFKTSEGNLEVLRGIDLTINQGEMTAVIGESGVGKSTLLHILGGLDKPSEGSVRLDGDDLFSKSEKEITAYRNKNIGFVFQHHYLLDDFTARENVMMPALIAGKSIDKASQLSEQLLMDVGLKDRMSHRPNQMSGGELQRAAVARALVNSPRVVIADEPSGNLDIRTGERLHSMLSELNRSKGITFVIATHNTGLARSCSRIVKLENGLAGEAYRLGGKR